MAASRKSATHGIAAYKGSIETIVYKYVRVGVCTRKKIYKNTAEYNKKSNKKKRTGNRRELENSTEKKLRRSKNSKNHNIPKDGDGKQKNQNK